MSSLGELFPLADVLFGVEDAGALEAGGAALDWVAITVGLGLAVSVSGHPCVATTTPPASNATAAITSSGVRTGRDRARRALTTDSPKNLCGPTQSSRFLPFSPETGQSLTRPAVRLAECT